mgnify:CR=1 FL=1|jgi:hypothetical protein
MKIKLTRNDLRNNFGVIVSCGCCELQSLLSIKNRVGYNKGVCGWNFDIFDFGGVGLITGYRTRGADIKLSREFCTRWNDRASNATYEGRKQILNEFERELQRLAREFVEIKIKSK